MKKKTDKMKEAKKKRKRIKESNKKTERIGQKNKKKTEKKERNPFDDYLDELEKYDAGTPKKIIEAED